MTIETIFDTTFATVAGFVSMCILLAGLAVSIGTLEYRFWPHGDRDWTFWVGWLSWTIYAGAFGYVAYYDAGGLFTPTRLVFASGVFLLVGGTVLSLVAMVQVGLVTSTGVTTELYTGGLYRYSRNPQYVGFITGIIGVILLSGSAAAGFLGVLGIIWLLSAPLAEEPWLREQYGEEYDIYCSQTPRFIGRPQRNRSQS